MNTSFSSLVHSLLPKDSLLRTYLSITNGIFSSKICDKRDDFNFEIIYHVLMEMFLAALPIDYIFHSLFIFLFFSFQIIPWVIGYYRTANLFIQGYQYHFSLIYDEIKKSIIQSTVLLLRKFDLVI